MQLKGCLCHRSVVWLTEALSKRTSWGTLDPQHNSTATTEVDTRLAGFDPHTWPEVTPKAGLTDDAMSPPRFDNRPQSMQ